MTSLDSNSKLPVEAKHGAELLARSLGSLAAANFSR
ncbi:hypothetical protein M5D96_009530 [Drosophila gunungcola]|uniref:Uncharacterized protein n=1 Tax=Drosophila gunungcola TaxID=103775 RepID=A0A9P9YIG2_9MUSC|nr:hypothetical protein M5D96_009530 [Drosophila gunungcola]